MDRTLLVQIVCGAVGCILGAIGTAAAFQQVVHRHGVAPDKKRAFRKEISLVRLRKAFIGIRGIKGLTLKESLDSGLLWGGMSGTIFGACVAWMLPEVGGSVAALTGVALLILLTRAIYTEVLPKVTPLIHFLGELGLTPQYAAGQQVEAYITAEDCVFEDQEGWYQCTVDHYMPDTHEYVVIHDRRAHIISVPLTGIRALANADT